MRAYLRTDLQTFKPYHAPLKPYEIKVDANESPYSHQTALIDHMTDWLQNKDNLTRYPDTDSHRLREKIAQVYGVHKDNILCGVGSDQIIELIIKVFIEPGDIVLVPTPSFSMYGLSTQLNHGRVVEIPLDSDFNYDVSKTISMIHQEKPKLVFLCTPNNPTGTILSNKEIKEILKVAKCPVIIDEAYAEFTNETMIDEIKYYENIIILRTFSKAYGLAGLRSGYALAQKEMIELINLARPPYNLSAYSQEASLFVLEHKAYYRRLIDELIENRQKMCLQLEKMPIIERIYESHANFLLLRVNTIGIATLLEQKKILVRDYPPTGPLANCIRITVGTDEENKRIIETLKEVNVI